MYFSHVSFLHLLHYVVSVGRMTISFINVTSLFVSQIINI